jgi:NADP-dependent 3-hydroxy acid dehydrogenase YdfG
VDVLVNNAGVNIQERRLTVLKPENWDLVVGVNLTGAYNMVQAVLPAMRKQGGGLIVNVSSMAGKRASGLSGTAYTAAKHGMNGMNESINAEEWRHGIRATVICPGEVNTEILDRRPVPVPPEERERLIDPADLAEAIRFVAALPPRTTVTEMLVMPTHKREFKAGETG